MPKDHTRHAGGVVGDIRVHLAAAPRIGACSPPWRVSLAHHASPEAARPASPNPLAATPAARAFARRDALAWHRIGPSNFPSLRSEAQSLNIDSSPGFTDRDQSVFYGPGPVRILRIGFGPGFTDWEMNFQPAIFLGLTATTSLTGNGMILRRDARFFAIATNVASLAARASAAVFSASPKL